MNIQKLRRCILYRVRVRPVARTIPRRHSSLPRDDVWIVAAIRPTGVVELNNPSTGHVALLGPDHIHHFDSDPMSESDGFRHGFLTLTIQISMSGCHLWAEPLSSQLRRGLSRRPKRRSQSRIPPPTPRP